MKIKDGQLSVVHIDTKQMSSALKQRDYSAG